MVKQQHYNFPFPKTYVANVAFQAKPFLEVFNVYFCPNCSSANTFEGEKCRTHGSLRPAQVVLRLDQQVHQRQALRLRARTRTAFVSNFYLQAKIGYK